jgi:glycosyltransferase involved in cell wall biosynthesis
VHFVDPVPPNEVVAWTASADLGVSLLEDTCLNHRLALPNKLFEYLVASVPVVVSHFPEMARIVNHYGVGTATDPSDPVALAEVFRRCVENRVILDDWCSNMPAVNETFRWTRASQAFLSEYESLGGRSGRSAG